MSATVLAVIGILVAALGTIAGFVYFDMDSGSALEGGLLASQGIMALEESAATFSETNGRQPLTMDELKSVGDVPDLPSFPGAAWAVGGGFVCLYGQQGTIADRSVQDAARRLGGKATVSESCGSGPAKSDAVVLSYPMAS